MRLTLPINIHPLEGRCLYVNHDKFFIENSDGLDVYDSESLSRVSPEGLFKKTGRMSIVWEDAETIHFLDNISVLRGGTLYTMDMSAFSVNRLGPCPLTGLHQIGIDSENLYLSANFSDVVSTPLSNPDLLNTNTILTNDLSLTTILPHGIMQVDMQKVFVVHNMDGSLIWKRCLNSYDIPREDRWGGCERKIINKTVLHGKNALYNLEPYLLICIDTENGSLLWQLEDAVDKTWCVSTDGFVYTVWQGILKKICATSGKLIFEKNIVDEWVQNEKELLNLFQIELTESHMWCGFLGHGICAINLETAKIDFHEFDGASLNTKPTIRNNQMFVQLTSGGLGIDNTEITDYILEGSGGYLLEPDS